MKTLPSAARYNIPELEKLHRRNTFECNIEMVPSLSKHLRIPSAPIQPCFKNAIWHVINPLKGKGYIQVQYLRAGEHGICIMDDNGVGSAASAVNHTHGHVSRGLDITRQRLALLLNDRQRAVEVIDKTNPDGSAAGTLVKIRNPLYEPAVHPG